jgi:hypothetical protein
MLLLQINLLNAPPATAGFGNLLGLLFSLNLTIGGDGFRVCAVAPGWYGGYYLNVGDVFDLAQANDFSDATLNYESAGGEYNGGWMTRVASTTALTQADGSGFLTTANRRFVV